MTQSALSRPSIDALRKAYSITSSARASSGAGTSEIECLGGLTIYHQRDFGGLLYW